MDGWETESQRRFANLVEESRQNAYETYEGELLIRVREYKEKLKPVVFSDFEIKKCIEVIQVQQEFLFTQPGEVYETKLFERVKEKLLAYRKRHPEVFSFEGVYKRG